MGALLLRTSALFAQLPLQILRARRVVLGAIVVLSGFFLYGIITLTELDLTTDSFLDQQDPSILALNEYRRQFGSDDSVFLVYEAMDGDVFSRRSLTALQALTADLENWSELNRNNYPAKKNGVPIDFSELAHLRRIQSIANLRIQRNVGDTLLSERLVPRELPASDAELANIKANALEEESYLLAFYSADARYGAILLQTDFGTVVRDDFSPAINSEEVLLDESFGGFSLESLDDDFTLDFDTNAAVDNVVFESIDMLGYTRFYDATQSIFEKYEASFDFYAVGNPPLMEFMQAILAQLRYLGAAVVLTFFFLLWTLFRSFSAVVWPLITIAMSIVWTWGITAWLGITISQMIGLTCLLVFAIGIADCVHVMSAYFSYRKAGAEHNDALSKSYGKTGLALFVTTLTTFAGMIALSTSEIIPIQVFSLMSALGVVMAFVFTIVLLPLLLDLWHPGAVDGHPSLANRLGIRWQHLSASKKVALTAIYVAALYGGLSFAIATYLLFASACTYIIVNWQQKILSRVPSLAQRYPYSILVIFGAIFVICAYGTTLVKIDSNMAELTRPDSNLRLAYDVVDENMAGAQSMIIMIDSHQTDGLLKPEVMRAIDSLQARIEDKYADQVSRTYSLANIVKEINVLMHEGDPAYGIVPDSQLMITQLLYLFNSANPADRRSLVSDDYSRANISLNIYNAGSYEYQLFFEEITEDIDEIFAQARLTDPELEVYLTGSMALMMRMADEVAQSQATSFILAIGVISVIMIITLGSFQAGAIAMAPNLIPALLSFGLMGLLGVPLDADTLLIAPLIIGIAVDDTIHFMTHYRVELLRTASIEKALRSTITEVGQAVMFTTMVLGLGLALLTFSDYLGMAKMGFFGSIAIFVALLCDLFLIPAMIIIFKPSFGIRDIDKTIRFEKESPA